MNGEQLERMAILALEYDIAREEETRASKQKEAKRDEIMALFKEAQEHRVEVGGYLIEAVPTLRESIPVKLARQLLDETLLKQLIQESTGITLKVTLKRLARV